MEQLSSRMTIVYKIIIPFGGLAGLIIYFVIILVRGVMLDFLIPLGFFLLFLWLIMFAVGMSIYFVFYNSTTVILKKFGKERSILLTDILHVKRFLINFYIIESRGKHKYIFIPHISEVMFESNSDPESIERFRGELKKLTTGNFIG